MDATILIDNKEIAPADGGAFERRDPITGTVVTRVAARKGRDVLKVKAAVMSL